MLCVHFTDLFHRMIALSGTGIADWAIEVNPLKMFKKQIAYSGILPSLSSNNRMAVRELRRYDAKKLYMDSHQFSRDNDRMTIFKPTIEAKSNTAFLTENPKIVWRTGSYKQRPMLFSFVPGEGAWIGSLFKSNEIISKGNLPSDLFLGSALELTAENVQKAMSYYLNETGTFSLDDVRSVLQVKSITILLIIKIDVFTCLRPDGWRSLLLPSAVRDSASIFGLRGYG